MKYLLAFFFFLMYAGDKLGLNIGFGLGLSPKNLLLYLTLVGIAINTAVARNRKLELLSIFVPFALLIFYALLTWLTVAFILKAPEYDPRQSFIIWKSVLVDQFLALAVFFFGVIQLRDQMWLLKAVIWIVLAGNLVTVIDTFNIPNLGILPVPEKAGRFEGFIGQPNAYGQFLVLFMAPAIALYFTHRGLVRRLAGIGVLATAVCLVMTGSRGTYVGLVGGAMLAAWFLRRLISTKVVMRFSTVSVLLIAAIITVTAATGYGDIYLDRFSGLEGNAHVATSGRTTIWKTALEAMTEQPLSFITGFGINAYDSSRSFRLSTHNVYLSYLYDLGVIGLALFVFIFFRVLAVVRGSIRLAEGQVRTHLVAMVFGLIGFMVAIFFSEYHASGYLLWAYVGVVLRISMTLREQSPAREAMPAVPRAKPATPPNVPVGPAYTRRF